MSFVVSASGELGVTVASDGCSTSGSGDIEGSGVSKCEVSSAGGAATEARGFLPRFLGTALEGEAALVVLSVAGVSACVGSTDSVARVRRLAAGLGVASSFWAAAFRGLPRPRPVLSGAGAGVNSSSSSCLTSGVGVLFSSWSESSTTGAFRRVAAARVDFLGDMEAMIAMAVGWSWLGANCAEYPCATGHFPSVVRTGKQTP